MSDQCRGRLTNVVIRTHPETSARFLFLRNLAMYSSRVAVDRRIPLGRVVIEADSGEEADEWAIEPWPPDPGVTPLSQGGGGMSGPREIPLRNRAREVVAYALVDEEDFAELNKHRWCRQGVGYAVRSVRLPGGGAQQLAMHRVILGLEAGDRRQVDHVNRDRLDNRRANLRIVTHAQNGQNVGAKSGSSSRYRGVYYQQADRIWKAHAQLDGRHIHLGTFKDELAAAEAAAEFRSLYMPFSEEAAA